MKEEKGKFEISIRRIHIFLITILVVISAIVVVATYHLTQTFFRIDATHEEKAELQKAARQLMDASDYLTEQAQRFTISGDKRFMENYFTEAFESNRREDALSKMDVDEKTKGALEQLQEAMESSISLMDQEYYSMRLVVEAKGYTDYPAILDEVRLSPEDAALSSADKIRRATELVLNDDYYAQKDRIRNSMQESMAEIDKLAESEEAREYASLKKAMIFVRVVIILHAITIILMVLLTSKVSLNPIIRAADKIKENEPIPEAGAKEFKYLAKAYNKMYFKNRSSLEQLNFKVSHDELTGAYNRFGYDYIISNIDIRNAHMMLIDVDDFKSINDNYGHDTGDKALQKVVTVLKSIFRDDDHICRIGGDEFVVFMVHSSAMSKRLIESKIEQINSELERTDDGLPPISISVGIVNGKNVGADDNIYEMTDAAMYKSKKSGKHTYTFYS